MASLSNFSRVFLINCTRSSAFKKQSFLCSKILPVVRLKSSEAKTTTEDIDAPLKYSTSRARSWSARQSRVGKRQDEEAPWFQPFVISLSLSIFLLYFCVYREENDIDQELNVSLYDRIAGLEKKQLQISLQYNLDNGIDATAINARLQEIEQQEQE